MKPEADLPFEWLAGPVTASLEDGRIPFIGDVTVGKPFSGNSEIAEILGEEVHISGNGNYDIETRRLLVDAVELEQLVADHRQAAAFRAGVSRSRWSRSAPPRTR